MCLILVPFGSVNNSDSWLTHLFHAGSFQLLLPSQLLADIRRTFHSKPFCDAPLWRLLQDLPVQSIPISSGCTSVAGVAGMPVASGESSPSVSSRFAPRTHDRRSSEIIGVLCRSLARAS